MFLLCLSLLSRARAGEEAEDSSWWFAELRSANAAFVSAFDADLALSDAPPHGTDPDVQRERRQLQDARLVEQQRLRELDAAELALREQLRTFEALATSREAEARGREQAVRDAAEASDLAFLSASSIASGLDPGAVRALERLHRTQQTLDWTALFEGRPSADAWQTQLAEVERLCGGEPPCVAVLDAVEAERKARLQRYQGGLEPPTERIAAIRVELADLDAARQTALHHIREISSNIAAIDVHTAGASETPDPTQQELRRLSAVYAELALRSAEVEAPIDARSRCEVFVLGGIARLAAGEPGATELLSDGVSAWGDACRGVAVPFLESPRVQHGWSEALYAASQRDKAWLSLVLAPGDWSLDGLPLFALDHVEIELPSGPHRLEHQSPDGLWHVVELELNPGERVGVWMDTERLTVVELPPGSVQPPRPERIVPVSVAELDVESLARELQTVQPPPSRLSASVGATWLRLDTLDVTPLDCFGLSAALQWRALSGPRAQLLLGLAHDHLRAPVRFDYADGYGLQALMRERLTLGVAGPAQWRVKPRVEASIGVLPLVWAPVAEVKAGVELSLSPTWSLLASGGVHSAWWADPYIPPARPTTTFALRVQL